MQRQIYYWNKAIGDPELLEKYKDKIEQLLAGEYKGPHLDTKRPGLYSIRLNGNDRLLFTTIVENGVSYLVILEIIKNHDYQKSKFLKKKTSLDALAKRIAEIEEIELKDEKVIGKEFNLPKLTPVEFYNDKFIVLNDEQCRALKTAMPLVVSGPAGSGKSCVALQLLAQCAEKYKDADKPILFVTESERLKSNIENQWQTSPETPGFEKVIFRTYEEILTELGKTKLVGKADFDTWFKAYIKKEIQLLKHSGKDLPVSLKQMDEVYQEFRHISVCSDKNDYMQLGQRDSSFNKTKEWIWQAYTVYMTHLKNAGYTHPAFTAIPDQDKYACIVVDEAQDFSVLQLNVLALLAEKRQICFCMDGHQSLYDNKSKLSYLLRLFGANHIALPRTYRCPENIVHAANVIIHMKHQLTGGKADKREHALVHFAPNQHQKGNVHWLDPKNLGSPEVAKKFEMLKNSTTFAVVTTPELIEEAKAYFKTPLVFTPDQIKGLEYKIVIAYKLFDKDPIYKQANSIISPEDINMNRENVNRPKKDDGNEVFGPPMNQVFTAFTRAMETLIICEDVKEHGLDNIMQLLHDDHFLTPWEGELKVEASSVAEWEAESKKLNTDHKEQAAMINEKLEQSKKPEAVKAPVPKQSRNKSTQTEAAVKAVKQPEAPTATAAPVKSNDMVEFVQNLLKNFIPNNIKKLFNFKLKTLIKVLFSTDIDGFNLFRRIAMDTSKWQQFSKAFTSKVSSLPDEDRRWLYNHACSTFYDAASDGDNTVVINLLGLNVDPNITHPETSLTPLHAAVKFGRFNIVESLLYLSNLNPNKTDSNEETALHYAVSYGNLEIVKLLLTKNGIDPNVATTFGMTPLHIAVSRGNIPVVEALLGANDIKPNLRSTDGDTPLILAIRNGDVDLIKILLNAKGIDLNSPGAKGVTPLIVAAGIGNVELVNLLFSKKQVDPHRQITMGYTALSAAAMRGHVEVVKIFRAIGGFDPNSMTVESLLYCVVYKGLTEVVKELLKFPGINPNLGTKEGLPPLYMAIKKGHVGIALMLLDAKGIDVNISDKEGMTPLILAVQLGHIEIVRKLLTLGALSTEIRPHSNILRDEINKDNAQQIEIFIKDNADSSGRLKVSILQIAESFGHTEIAALIKSHTLASARSSEVGIFSASSSTRSSNTRPHLSPKHRT